jgi:replication initiation protein RepC
MTGRLATTPFGGARVSVRQFARQKWIAERQTALAELPLGSPHGKADKWQLLRALTEARDIYGLSDRSITVLEALASFHQSRELDGSAPIIVFPSNAELSMRTRGMSPATLRRHLCALVQSGLILRRDSPNGKRYCRRGQDGETPEAFGFDIAPMALMATDIIAHAEALKAEQRERQKLRSEITIHLRDIAKTIAAAKFEAR